MRTDFRQSLVVALAKGLLTEEEEAATGHAASCARCRSRVEQILQMLEGEPATLHGTVSVETRAPAGPLPAGVVEPNLPRGTEVGGPGAGPVSVDLETPYRVQIDRVTTAFKRAYLARLLEATGGNVSEAARRSGLNRVYLHEMIRRFTERPSR